MQLSLKNINNHTQLKRALLILLTLAIWCFLLWRVINVFGPGRASNNVSYNSDAAIPVLMSNDDRPITIFNLYYYGADRWGGWPLLITQGIRRTTGFQWSDQSLFRYQAIWILLGVIVMGALSRRDFALVALVYVIALCLNSESRYLIFEMSQLYAWQITALLLSWFSLRQLMNQSNEPSSGTFSVWRISRWHWLTFWFSFLAIWSSVASIPILLFLLCLETARAHLLTLTSKEQRPRGGIVRGLIPVLAAILAEALTKMNYHRHGLKHYGEDFMVLFELDTAYFRQNLSQHVSSLSHYFWGPLYLLPALALIAAGAYFLYGFQRNRIDAIEKLRRLIHDDLIVLVAGAYGIALINFLLVVLVSHVRLSDYDIRFLTLASLFGPIAGLLTLFLILRWAATRFGFGLYVKPAFIVAATLFLLIRFPGKSYDIYYGRQKETAQALAQKSPGGILMGGYWQTYVFASLQPLNAMTPVPVEGQENRMPWTREMVRQAKQIVLEYRQSRIADSGQPPERLSQYGNTFRLVDPKWYENENFAFALYTSESQ